ncbi:MAG TPA: MFS transporter [Candidatus Avirikenella pullistercoris]|nr:MFS transporter [Candidatus Avirikenella pullistercoris]
MKIETGNGSISLLALIAIYSVSMVTSLPGLAISPILGELENVFKGAGQFEIQMLESLPSYVIIPFVLLSGKLSMSKNKNRILFIGLALFVVSSLLYFTANSITMLLVYSITLGIGAGIVIPFSTGLIADFFSGVRRTTQLGIVSSVTNIMLVLATLLAGFLAGIGWKYAFIVYCFSIIPLILVFFIPKQAAVRVPVKSGRNEVDPITGIGSGKPKMDTGKTERQSVGKRWPLKLMSIYFFVTAIVLVIPFNLSIYMENLHIGNSDYSGTVISLFFLAMTVPGFFITKIVKVLKKNVNFLSLLFIAAGLCLFLITEKIWILTGAAILVGVGYGIMQPLIYDKTATAFSAHATFALALVMSMNYLAIIVYPFVLKILGTVFHISSVHFPFILNAVLGVAFMVFAFFRRDTPTLGIMDKTKFGFQERKH